ncbi:MAG: primosomal protein N', partial [Bacteroidales bacterium]|nr:primosomal protein N' [Bacteroidales bacterium]
LCTLGEVMDAALPRAFKLKSSSEESDLSLRYSSKTMAYVSLAGNKSESELNETIDGLQRSPAGKNLLMQFLEMSSFGEENRKDRVLKNELLKRSGASSASLALLVRKNIFCIDKVDVERDHFEESERINPLPLSEKQMLALTQIREAFLVTETVLLKGVTSSGKTELYIHLIQEQLASGRQVLYLLPEIALTTQLINRLRKYFGNEIGVYHSRFNDNERADVWLRTAGDRSGRQYKIILGVRSSLFLPFTNLGLIIVDEEHDSSYKQSDPAPRYNARDSAVVLAKLHNAKVLMGSATPSLESVFNCAEGKYSLVELNSRYGDVQMPDIEIADSKEAYRRKIMISHFTPRLIDETENTLARGEQVVYFRNRRGYTPLIMCNECGWVPHCPDCSVSMTWHKGINKLKCHYCGHKASLPTECANCKSPDLSMKGFGTEKIEDELSIMFPDYKVERMDLDTTRKKGSLERIISRLEKGEIDILVGTQMISKGLDFENLTLVGVLNIDNMLSFPDFRASERCFQQIEQVSGRAGRRKKRGKVILQTLNPSHPIIKQSVNHDYNAMYLSQMEERKEFKYPPFSRLIKIYIKHRDRLIVTEAANKLAVTLRSSEGFTVLGPEYPVINRIQNSYIMTILIKIDRDDKGLNRLKQFIKLSIVHIKERMSSGALRIYADVDPV